MANPIETNAKLARAVGILAGRWGQAEFYVEQLFLTLNGGAEPRKATIIFSFLKAVQTQRDVIELMLGETPRVDVKLRAEIKVGLKEFADLARERNEIIHYPFGLDSTKKTNRLYKAKRLRKGPELYVKNPTSAKAVMAVADRVKDVAERLSGLSVALVTQITAPLPLPDTPPPPPHGQTQGLLAGLTRPSPSATPPHQPRSSRGSPSRQKRKPPLSRRNS